MPPTKRRCRRTEVLEDRIAGPGLSSPLKLITAAHTADHVARSSRVHRRDAAQKLNGCEMIVQANVTLYGCDSTPSFNLVDIHVCASSQVRETCRIAAFACKDVHAETCLDDNRRRRRIRWARPARQRKMPVTRPSRHTLANRPQKQFARRKKSKLGVDASLGAGMRLASSRNGSVLWARQVE